MIQRQHLVDAPGVRGCLAQLHHLRDGGYVYLPGRLAGAPK